MSAVKAKRSSGQVKSTVMAVSVMAPESSMLGQAQAGAEPVIPQADYSAFISDGWVSLDRSGDQWVFVLSYLLSVYT